MLVIVALSITVVAGLIAALVFVRNGPKAFAARAERDFAELKKWIGACLEQDLRLLDARLPAPGAEAGYGPPGAETAREYRRLAESHALRAWAADGTTYWREVSACTEALAKAGRELARGGGTNPPCLFDPAHGPSSTTVEWRPGEHGRPRQVPACAVDAAAVAAGQAPAYRYVTSDGGEVRYFDAYGLYASWLLGYFSGFDTDLTARLLAGTPLGAHLPDLIRGTS
ncbi:hypothetical protein HII36_11090 [Nonomuraea sp. NN258]|uniref:hypothetical protein n=1 Tax=Nonomuraea antri TaxID=2730852 RepID=UPI001569610A|nr:hypothetical protein [Nonomuraea antri]NRQ32380.1 hypothetical protein [Nonomuraea antri]